jgi:SAM-dependent methyltransferase
MIPTDVTGRDVIELGCGTAYVSAWLARRGARVVGIDNSEVQLATARRMQVESPGDFGVEFHLSHGDWIRLLRHSGFEIEELIELRPPRGSQEPLSFRYDGVGSPMALRGGLESEKARLGPE